MVTSAPRKTQGHAVIGVGVDFGTSNSTVAWFDGEQLRFVQIETASPILPTAVHLSRDFVGTTGRAAIDRYVLENTARLVHLVPEIVGHAAAEISERLTDADIGELDSNRNAIYGPLIDHGLPGRLFLGLKRLLGDPAIDRLLVFNRFYRLVALLTPILLRMREGIEAELRAPVRSVHIGRPVHFEGKGSGCNAFALGRLNEACAHAGFSGVEFYAEPVAATLSFLRQQQRLAKGVVLTVDFGGGTLDLSVIRYAGLQFEVLATAGASLGGDRIDQLIYKHLVFPHLGEGEVWRRQVNGRAVETLFPFNEYEEGLLNWAITHNLNQNKYKTRLTELIARGGTAAVKFERLRDLINYNYSYGVFSAIRQAKAALSVVAETTIDIPELNLTIPFTRTQFDAMLCDMMTTLRDLIRLALQRASLVQTEIDVVVRTGGSSQIIAVGHLLEEFFPGKATEHDPFTSVAGGLAIANYHRYRFADFPFGIEDGAP